MKIDEMEDCPKCKLYLEEIKNLEKSKNAQWKMIAWLQDELILLKEKARSAQFPPGL
jgi:hypothetical protein